MAKRLSSEVIRIPLPLPMRGVNRNFSRSAQPDATCWDATNILPIDRQGRLRLALRGGAKKIQTLDGASKVRLVHVASTIGSGSGLIYNEDWSYSNGNLATVSSGVWVIAHEDHAKIQVSTGTAVTSIIDSPPQDYKAQYNGTEVFTAPAVGTYTVAFSVSCASTSGNIFDDANIQVNFARAPGLGETITDNLLGGWGITITHDRLNGTGAPETTVELFTQTVGGSNTFYDETPFPAANASGDYSIEVTGNDFVVKRNGSTILSGTDANFAIPVTHVSLLKYLAHVNVSGTPTMSITSPITVSVSGTNRSILKLVSTSGDDTYLGTDPTAMAVVTNSGTYPIDSTSTSVSAATLFLKTYIVDGLNIRQLNLVTGLFEAYTASAGTAPTGCTIAVGWRGRLVLSGDSTDPQNVFASKSGDPTNWDYAVDPATETMAWAANAANLGKIGEPVLALVPLSDDILLIGCEQSIWAVRGDIAADGSIDNITEGAGIISQSAWCRSADGNVYFVGPNGLYRSNPDGSVPSEISRDAYRQFFKGINRATEHVTLVFDKERYGVWIFVTPEASADAPVRSLFYDIRLDGYWPIKFTNVPDAGPVHAAYWDGLDAGTRYPVLGSYTGSLYSLNFTDRFDNDGSDKQIVGSITMGPVSLSNVDDAILTKFDVTAGELASGDTGVFEMQWTAQGGPSANSVTEGTPAITATGTFVAGDRAQTQYPRVRGGWFTMKFENGSTSGDYFSLENVVLHILPAGTQRV